MNFYNAVLLDIWIFFTSAIYEWNLTVVKIIKSSNENLWVVGSTVVQRFIILSSWMLTSMGGVRSLGCVERDIKKN